MERFFGDKPRPLGQVIKSIFLAYIHIFKPIFVLLVVFASIQFLKIFFQGATGLTLVTVSIVSLLVGIFLYTALLKIGNEVLYSEPYGLYDVVTLARDRLLMLLAGIVLLSAIQGVIWLVSYGVGLLSAQLYAQALLAILILLAIIYVNVLLYFVIPLIALEGMNPFAALRKSVGLVYGHWWVTFSLVGGMLLITGFLISFGVIAYLELNVIYTSLIDFLVVIIMGPLYFSLTLVLLHELEVRQREERETAAAAEAAPTEEAPAAAEAAPAGPAAEAAPQEKNEDENEEKDNDQDKDV